MALYNANTPVAPQGRQFEWAMNVAARSQRRLILQAPLRFSSSALIELLKLLLDGALGTLICKILRTVGILAF